MKWTPNKVQKACNIFNQLGILWREFQDLFSLLPQYPQLQILPQLLNEVDEILFPSVEVKTHSSHVYSKILEFLKLVIVPITQKYELEIR